MIVICCVQSAISMGYSIRTYSFHFELMFSGLLVVFWLCCWVCIKSMYFSVTGHYSADILLYFFFYFLFLFEVCWLSQRFADSSKFWLDNSGEWGDLNAKTQWFECNLRRHQITVTPSLQHFLFCFCGSVCVIGLRGWARLKCQLLSMAHYFIAPY